MRARRPNFAEFWNVRYGSGDTPWALHSISKGPRIVYRSNRQQKSDSDPRLRSGSVEALGIDGVIELFSGPVLLWRLCIEANRYR